MSFERAGYNDPLTRMTDLQTSTIMEMLSGLQVLSHPWKKGEWKEKAASVLGTPFMESLKNFYERYQIGTALIEIAIEFPDHHDVPGFISHVRTMPQQELAFYLLGRVYPLEVVPEVVSRETIEKVITAHRPDMSMEYIETPIDWADAIEVMRTEATDLWTTYWDTFYKDYAASLKDFWEEANRELEDILFRSGGSELYRKFSSQGKLPPQIPEGMPYRVIRYIPVYHLPGSHVKYFGYGNITILYDCKRNTKYERSIEQAGQAAFQIARALGDEKRLRILKIISDHEFGMNGKSIAAKMDLSASVVSRHLSQLKKAGLINEKSEDNRNITYRLNWKRIDEFSELLMLYLGSD